MRIRTILIVAALLILGSAVTGRTVPQLINYQGILEDTGGSPVTTTTNVIFAIWDDSAAGDSLWSEQQSITPDSDGRFNVLLGSVSPIPDSAFDSTETYLSVKVGTDPEMSPRQRIVSVGYAYRVGSLDGALGGVIESEVTIGIYNTNTGEDAFVAGFANVATNSYSTVTGGLYDSNLSTYGVICGGSYNVAEGDQRATIVGGGGNRAAADYTFIGAGSENTAVGTYSGVMCGRNNLALGDSSCVGGGSRNSAWALNSTVCGGANNVARGPFSVVAGGGGATDADSNAAAGHHSVVSGGMRNIASNQSTTVSGGRFNVASGEAATVPGGSQNAAAGPYSLAAGRRAKANHAGVFIWADQEDADFTSERVGQFRVRASGGLKVDDGSEWIDLRDDGADLITTSSGAHLTLGGSWTNSSDRNAKENFAPIDGDDLLRKLAALKISQWNYKTESDDIKHIGPVAQDFYRIFGFGAGDKSISTIDPAGIALAAIQELNRRTERIAELESELRELRHLVDQLMQQ